MSKQTELDRIKETVTPYHSPVCFVRCGVHGHYAHTSSAGGSVVPQWWEERAVRETLRHEPARGQTARLRRPGEQRLPHGGIRKITKNKQGTKTPIFIPHERHKDVYKCLYKL